MITISLCMIVKNEEKVLNRCLNSIKDIVDEIIIIDTGSTDKTKKIAKSYTKYVYDFKWEDDFSKARNFSFSKATKDYIMWLDADDVVLDNDRKKILKLKSTLDTSTDIVMFKYNTGFDENDNVNFSYYRERLLKRSNNYKWVSPIHEVIIPNGKIMYSDIAITHKKQKQKDMKRNLNIFESMIKKGTKLDARQEFYYARELYYNSKFNEAITVFNNFLENPTGWIENKIDACILLSKCYQEIGNKDLSFLSLFKSFIYDTPRAETCCELGNLFLKYNNYYMSIYWYEFATNLPINMENGGFCSIDSYKYIPYLQLCVCYFKIGDYEKSKKYNKLAGKEKPYSKSYLSNKILFEKLEKNK